MAKKEKKIEVINEEVEILTNISHEEDVKPVENKIDAMTLSELFYAEQVVKSVCKKYENSLKSYDGTILRNSRDYNKFETLNGLHSQILNKMEVELLKLL